MSSRWKQVKAIENGFEFLQLIPGLNVPASIGKAAIDFGQGDFQEVGENTINIIPGIKILSKINKLPKLDKIVDVAKGIANVAKEVANSRWLRKNIIGKIPATGQNLRQGYQILGGRFKFMVHKAHSSGHTRPHYQIHIGREGRGSGKVFKIRKPIGDRFWKWTRGTF